MKTFCLEVSGPFACFTRPEMKVERVSYDVITPSAARAVFEAVLWKPAFRWRVTKIEVLKPIRWINLRRNEVGARVSVRNAEQAMEAGTGALGLYVEDERQQRAGLFLRDVAYRLHAAMEIRADRADDSAAVKFWSMFERRAAHGQCVNQPYLGCREFAADFRLVDEPNPRPPIAESRDLGFMLHDLDFGNGEGIAPRFFRAQMRNGVIEVPAFDSDEVRQ
ncbi:MAG: type I-C CRISPR-associated protein Cas5c [Burkholderiaceae bacterium]